jgi:hypothetical protein
VPAAIDSVPVPSGPEVGAPSAPVEEAPTMIVPPDSVVPPV